jgi:uncharacterized membrane protein
MNSHTKADRLIPAGLLALSLVPALAGAVRLMQIGAGAAVTPDNARFVAAPWPVALHVVSAVFFCAVGAFQFAPGWRQRHPAWHRAAGRVLVLCGLLAALSGLWMTQFYPPGTGSPARFDGPAVYAMRLLMGSAMAGSLCLGLAAILRRDIPQHRAWMLRGYAIGLGAGTQAITHLPWFLFPAIQGEAARAVLMGAGWLINLAVAEWLIAQQPQRLSV